MTKQFVARLQSERGGTFRDGCTVRETVRDSRENAQRWIDTEVNAELAAGRSPGRATIVQCG